jgi:hypothetical protein
MNGLHPQRSPILGIEIRSTSPRAVAEIVELARELRPVAQDPAVLEKHLAAQLEQWRNEYLDAGKSEMAAHLSAERRLAILRNALALMVAGNEE